MNKIVSSILAMFLGFNLLVAQPKFAAGGSIGVNFANQSSNISVGNEQGKTGFHIGATATMTLGKNGNMFVVGELNYNQKGGFNNVSGTNSTSYLDIPILLRHTITIKKDFPLKAMVNVGPYWGFKLARQVVPATGAYADSTHSTNFLEFGLAAGVGVVYPFGKGDVFLEGRYSSAISSMIPASLERNSMFTISFGYLYYLQGRSQEEKDKTIDSGFE